MADFEITGQNLSPKKRALLELLKAEKDRKQRGSAPDSICPREDRDVFPMASIQRRLWFLSQYVGESPVYNVAMAYRLEGPLDVDKLIGAFTGVVNRHEVLRSYYVNDGGEPVQKVKGIFNSVVDYVDLSGIPEVDRYPEAERRISADAVKGFDLAVGPLIRSKLFKLSSIDHVLYVNVHHILCDGGSLEILFRDLAAAYQDPANLRQSLPLQYADFAVWQNKIVAGDTLSKQLEYWKEQLEGIPKLLQLSPKTRPQVQRYQGEKKVRRLDSALYAKLTHFAAQQGITLFTLFLAGFQLLLHRESGVADILVGSPVSGRNCTELESLVGCFVNLLPLRLRVDDDPVVTEAIRRARETALDAHENQDLPFEKIVEALNLDRTLDYNPVFQVGFAFHQAGVEPPRLPGVRATRISIDTKTSKWDLTLEVVPEGGSASCVLEYNTDLFDSEHIDRMLGHCEVLLGDMVQRPGARVSELAVLTDHERHQIVTEWNAVDSDYPRTQTIHQLFAEQARTHGGMLAAQYGDEKITYSELNCRSNQLANYLRARNVNHGDKVALCVERSISMLIATLGILKAGAAYVPLDPTYPAERLSFMLEDCNARMLLTQQQLAGKISNIECQVLRLDTDWDQVAVQSNNDPNMTGSSEDVAYVMYTSGSTGIPKGIEILHRGIARLVLNTNYVSLTAEDRVAQLSNTSFDAATFEIWGALLNGGRLVGLTKEVVLSPEEFVSEVRKQKITTLFLTTALFNQLARQVPDAFHSVKNVLFGGEAVDPRSVSRVLQYGAPRRLLHVYGPTECTTFTTWHLIQEVPEVATTIPIGRPLANTSTYVLDKHRQPVQIGATGELYIGGEGLARGYLNRPELTEEKFVPDPFSRTPGARLYRSGDLAKYDSAGAIEFIGRIDEQVKIRGFRIELGEISAALLKHESVQDAVVIVRELDPGEKQLVAYVVAGKGRNVQGLGLRSFLKQTLPEYMVPAEYMFMDVLPLNANGKVHRDALPAPIREVSTIAPSDSSMAPRTELERQIAEIWQEVLERPHVGRHENFFDLGGHSLLLTKVHGRLQKKLGRKFAVIDLFKFPTVSALATYMGDTPPLAAIDRTKDEAQKISREPIAIVAMTGRFPGSNSVEELWQNLRAGREGIRQFTDEELAQAGVPAEYISNPNYVRAGSILSAGEECDATFFGFSAREAEVTDPQQRLFLECAHEALEKAGYDPQTYTGRIGVYAGSTMSTYFTRNVLPQPGATTNMSELQLTIANDKDFLATRVAYKLNLKGPAVTVQTACSTSLVAVHSACEALQNGHCDMALAGGVSIHYPQGAGYMYQEQGIGAPDGHCRPFDANAAGTVPGNGAGVVVLKRMSDAIAGGDRIEAVILGSAINNDGSNKIGYTSPSVNGQADVIQAAQRAAGVDAQSITCVEAHGTGTPLGDPIEVAALTQAFRLTSAGVQYCALGSVKSNLGHLDAAAGVTGLIKAVLQLKHKELVPSLHYDRPNPKIDFEASPFFVNARLRPWDRASDSPRRAGVSSFGIGGTNVHVVLEEAPEQKESAPSREWQVLTLSAKTPRALSEAAENLATRLMEADEKLADVSHTLNVGRTAYKHRQAIVCRSKEDAATLLRGVKGKTFTGIVEAERPVAFLFPGQGAQYVQMGRELYDTEVVFRNELSKCAELLRNELGLDIRDLLYSSSADSAESANRLKETRFTQPILFAIEWALAQQWISWRIKPEAMAGHSIGEYTAATLAGVMELEDALRIVAARGRIMQAARRGAMLSVPLSETEVAEYLREGVWLSAVNAPQLVVLGGEEASITRLESELKSRNIEGKRLQTSHAFHTGMMDEVLAEFQQVISGVKLKPPQLRYLSNVTGTWVTSQEATSADYWVKHIRGTVRFGENIRELLARSEHVLLEVGPGSVLGALVRQQAKQAMAVNSLAGPQDKQSATETMACALGRLWTSGVKPNWDEYWKAEKRIRVPLPTYPFERQRYFIAPDRGVGVTQSAIPAMQKKVDLADWFYGMSWERSVNPNPTVETKDECYLIIKDADGVGDSLRTKLARTNKVISVVEGSEFKILDVSRYEIRSGEPDDYRTLLQRLCQHNAVPTNIIYLWNVNVNSRNALQIEFESLLSLARGIGTELDDKQINLIVITSGTQDVTGSELLAPENSVAIGACNVIPQEYPNIRCRMVDLDPSADPALVVDHILDEQSQDRPESLVAYRGRYRWVPKFKPVRLEAPALPQRLRSQGVYLITGGLGGVGLEIALYLARTVQARIGLLSRSEFPSRESWAGRLHSDPDSRLTKQIRKLIEIGNEGGEARIIRGDVSEFDDVERAISEVQQAFGNINGVVHAAGIPGGSLIQGQTREQIRTVFAPKVQGTQNLYRALKNVPLDFVLLCSSQRSVLGAPGRVEYCAANAFVDAFATNWRRECGSQIISVMWDSWKETGMGMNATAAPCDDDSHSDAQRFGMSNVEGIEVFRRTLDTSFSPVLVSTVEWAARVEQHRHLSTVDVLEQAAKDRYAPSAHSRPDLSTLYVAPRTDTEKILADLWQELLGIDRVGVHDNFFELGGDSVVSLQLVTKARARGLAIGAKQVFQQQTVAELAAVAASATVAPETEGNVIGEAPLLPIQQWFFQEHLSDANEFVHAMRLKAPANLIRSTFEQAVEQILKQHDALRASFALCDGVWQQVIAPHDQIQPVTYIDLTGVPDEMLSSEIAAVVDRLASEFEVSSHALYRFAWIDCGADRGNEVVIVIHHLVIDIVSWRILLEDIETLCRQPAGKAPVCLPAKTTSVRKWSQKLRDHLNAGGFDSELRFWLSSDRKRAASLCSESEASNTNESHIVDVLSAELDAHTTDRLLHDIPPVFGTQINDSLLAALAHALATCTESDTFLVEMEGLGRDATFADVDLSRTVGWLTCVYPILVKATSDEPLHKVAQRVRLESNELPNRGIGYGALRFLSSNSASALRHMPRAQISFLYLGQQQLGGKSSYWPEFNIRSSFRSYGNPTHPLSLMGAIVDRRLHVDFVYDRKLLLSSTVRQLADHFVAGLHSLIDESSDAAVGNATTAVEKAEPGDFQWSESELGNITAALSKAMGKD